jgi:hypothetical protein
VEAKKTGIKKSVVTGAGIGITYTVLHSCWCLSFWYGGKLEREGEIDVGTLVIVSEFTEFLDTTAVRLLF